MVRPWNRGLKGITTNKKGGSTWNKNLTKENSEKIRGMANKQSQSMKRLHLDGKIISPKTREDLKEIHNEIIKLYLEGKTCKEIGKAYNCSFNTIYRILIKEGISTSLKGRKKSESHILKMSNNMIKRYKDNPSLKEKIGILRRNKSYEELYGPNKANEIKEIISKFSSGENNKMFGKSKELCPAWLGGKSFEPYTLEFNKAFKEAIRKRDGFLCLKCGMHEEDNKVLFGKILTTHHIDYNKLNSIPQNCCVLCNRCHIEVNTNRNSWTKFFQSMLTERYGYKYTEDGKVIIKLNLQEEKI